VCRGDAVTLGAEAAAGASYLWQPATGLDDPFAARPVAAPAATTSYRLTVIDAASGCIAEDLTVVSVRPTPTADAGRDQVRPATLGPEQCDPNLVYRWTPATGLGDPSACNPVADPDVDTVYCLTIRDISSGCDSDADCVLVAARVCSSLPGAVTRLDATRQGQDVALTWSRLEEASGGYHAYRAGGKDELARPPGEGVRVVDAAGVDATGGVDAGAVAAEVAGPFALYRVVAVCDNGIGEGP
jgi:hypothetical protein